MHFIGVDFEVFSEIDAAALIDAGDNLHLRATGTRVLRQLRPRLARQLNAS